jgi:hypothetical protein
LGLPPLYPYLISIFYFFSHLCDALQPLLKKISHCGLKTFGSTYFYPQFQLIEMQFFKYVIKPTLLK